MQTRRVKPARKKVGEKQHFSRSATRFVAPLTAEDLYAMPESSQEKWIAITNTITKSRVYDISIPKAAREFEVDPRIVRRLARPALRKLKNGRYAVKPWDRLLRVVVVITKRGLVEVPTWDSRQASKAARHSAAVQRYLETGDATRVLKFRGKYIVDAEGKRVRLLTDLSELERLGSAGVPSFESLYARSA